MKKIITTLILCCSIASLFACSCRHVPFGVKKIIDSDLFFKGKIIEKANVNIDKDGKDAEFFEKRGIGLFRYKIEVSDYVKGAGEKNIYVYSNMGSAACGVDYTVGGEIYIFSYANGGRNYTSSCSGNFSAKYGNEEPNNTIIRDYKKAIRSQKWKNEANIIEAEGEISNRLPTGTWKFHHDDGTVSSKGKYKKGLKKGKWEYYHKDGSLSSVGKFKKGKRKGKWKSYLDKKESQEFIAKEVAGTKVWAGQVLNFITVYKKGEVLKTEEFVNGN